LSSNLHKVSIHSLVIEQRFHEYSATSILKLWHTFSKGYKMSDLESKAKPILLKLCNKTKITEEMLEFMKAEKLIVDTEYQKVQNLLVSLKSSLYANAANYHTTYYFKLFVFKI